MAERIDEEEELTGEDRINQILEARRGSKNLSYYAFTATPKPRTLELFGRVPNPALPPGKDNLPEAFHVYSMRQAIEEGFILDVLRNYISYGTAYKIAQKKAKADSEVDKKKAAQGKTQEPHAPLGLKPDAIGGKLLPQLGRPRDGGEFGHRQLEQSLVGQRAKVKGQRFDLR